MIEKALEEIRVFYRKYYNVLPAEGQDVIREELNKEEHLPEDVFLLLARIYRWKRAYQKMVDKNLQKQG